MKEEFKRKGTTLRESQKCFREAVNKRFSQKDLEAFMPRFERFLQAADVGVEEVIPDSLDGVFGFRIITKNLNPSLIRQLESICQNVMNAFPEIAIEIEPPREYGYFYGKEIYLFLASEWYQETPKKTNL